jgi:hypothetical protein
MQSTIFRFERDAAPMEAEGEWQQAVAFADNEG